MGLTIRVLKVEKKIRLECNYLLPYFLNNCIPTMTIATLISATVTNFIQIRGFVKGTPLKSIVIPSVT